jgi:hypothetical protein
VVAADSSRLLSKLERVMVFVLVWFLFFCLLFCFASLDGPLAHMNILDNRTDHLETEKPVM